MTQLEVWDYSVMWRIEDFTSCQQELGLELKSHKFTIEAFDRTKWYLSVYPGGHQEDDKVYFTCFLNKSDDNISENDYDVTFKFEISTAEKKVLRTYQSTKVFKNGEGAGPTDAIKIEDVMAELKKCSSDTLLISCSMKRNDKSNMQSVKKEIRTKIVSDKCSFEWIVKFLKNLEHLKGRNYFSLGAHFYQISISALHEDVIITVKTMKEKVSVPDLIIGKVTLLDVQGDEALSKKDVFRFGYENGKSTWEFPPLLNKGQLLDNAGQYVKDGSFVLHCEFSIRKDENAAYVSKLDSQTFAYMDSLISLSDDFERLFVDKTNSNVKLLTNNETELQAHKLVLAVRSPVFSAMFDQEMIENRTGIVKVEDVDSKTLESFLKFLYTGVVDDMDSERATKLLLVAEKYQVSSLKEVCASFLMTTLSVDNVCEILTVADKVHHEELKNMCLDFVVHHATNIISSPDFSNWVKENSKLLVEITINLGKTVDALMSK